MKGETLRVSGKWLQRPETQAVMAMFGIYRALLVGGCVRNAVIGVPVEDVDIATDALPDVVIALADRAGLRAVPTGIAHGTVTVISGSIPHEVTTFRRDVETDGRHAVVTFAASLEQDAARRDFTMNALYAQADGTVIDPLGGLPDLLAGRVRFVGDPAARIAEDTLRILRFFRFHAWFGDPDQGLDPDAMAACAAQSVGVEPLSRERVGAEMRKLLDAPDPAPAVAAMVSAGILAQVLPGASADSLAPLVHLEAGAPRSWMRRLVVMGGEDPTAILRLSRAESREWALLRDLIGGGEAPAELAYRHGAARALDVLLLRAAVFEAELPARWQAQVKLGAAAVFPVVGSDLIPQFQGAEIGSKLAALEVAWIASGFRLTKAELLA